AGCVRRISGGSEADAGGLLPVCVAPVMLRRCVLASCVGVAVSAGGDPVLGASAGGGGGGRAGAVFGRSSERADTLHLFALQRAALAQDPRARSVEHVRAATALRLESLAAERLPRPFLRG